MGGNTPNLASNTSGNDVTLTHGRDPQTQGHCCQVALPASLGTSTCLRFVPKKTKRSKKKKKKKRKKREERKKESKHRKMSEMAFL